MARPAVNNNEDVRLIGFQATNAFHRRLKVAAAKRGLSMKEAIHNAVEMWLEITEGDEGADDESVIAEMARRAELRENSNNEDRPRIRRVISENEVDEEDDDEAFPILEDDEDLSHGDDLIVEDDDEDDN